MLKNYKTLVYLLLSLTLVACQKKIPEDALMLKPESLQLRKLQTRSFDTEDEKKLLKTSTSVLQDLGFNLDESQIQLGLLVASKDRDAMETGQVAGAVVFAVLTGKVIAIDNNQKIRVSVVTAPNGKNKTNLRVTFQRIVWNTQGQVSKIESVEDEKIYQDFFSKLSKGVFLTAHEV